MAGMFNSAGVGDFCLGSILSGKRSGLTKSQASGLSFNQLVISAASRRQFVRPVQGTQLCGPQRGITGFWIRWNRVSGGTHA